MTEAEFMADNQTIMRTIVETSHRYRAAGDWDALLKLSRLLNAGAQAVYEVFASEGCIAKELSLDDVLGRKH